MRRLIVRSNQWYDNLKEPNRALFFLVFVMGGLIVAQYFMVVEENPWLFIGWSLLLTLWRVSYVFTQNFKKDLHLVFFYI